MVSLWNVLCLFQRFPLIPIPPDKLSESRLRSLLDTEPLNLDSYVSFSLLDCDNSETVFEHEIRPTPAALIDKEFVAKIEAFFQKETEFNERLEQIQRVAEQLDLSKRAGRFQSTGVLADLDPPRIGPPGPYPLADLDPRGPYRLADLDPPPRIWTP